MSVYCWSSQNSLPIHKLTFLWVATVGPRKTVYLFMSDHCWSSQNSLPINKLTFLWVATVGHRKTANLYMSGHCWSSQNSWPFYEWPLLVLAKQLTFCISDHCWSSQNSLPIHKLTFLWVTTVGPRKTAYLALFLNLRTLLCIVATEPVSVFVPEN